MRGIKRDGIAVPHVSFEAAKKAILSLYSSKKASSAKELAVLANLNVSNTSKALSVARSMGFVMQTSHGVYDLTRSGKKLAHLLSYRKDEEAKELVRDALLTSDSWAEIIAFLRSCIANPREPMDLVFYIESKLDKQWTPSMRKSLASMYKSVLVGGGLVNPDSTELVPTPIFERTLTSLEEHISDFDQSVPVKEMTDSNQYVTFNLSGVFTLKIKQTKESIGMVREQVKDDSPLAAWLDATLKMLSEEKRTKEQ